MPVQPLTIIPQFPSTIQTTDYAQFGMISEPEQSHGTALGEMVALVDIIREPTLARIYTAIRHTGPKSVNEIVDELDVPERTAYDSVYNLGESGFLQTTTDTYGSG